MAAIWWESAAMERVEGGDAAPIRPMLTRGCQERPHPPNKKRREVAALSLVVLSPARAGARSER
jgi:hypothetical protein